MTLLNQAMDRAVQEKVNEIMRSRTSAKGKYEALDALYLRVTEYHPDGIAAHVLQTISAKQTEVMYPNGKEVMPG